MGVCCPVRRRVPASAPRAPAAQVRTFSPNASKLGVSGGNSGRRLDNALPSPRGADPPLTEMEGKRLLPSFLPSFPGEQGLSGTGDGEIAGAAAAAGGSAALNTSSSSSPTFPSAGGSGRRESTGMITQTLQGGFGSRGEITHPGISTRTFCWLSFSARGLRWGSLI